VAIKAIEEREAERDRLIELATRYVDGLARRLDVRAAAIAGSVARGDFNLWSDVDVVLIAAGLPARAPDRAALLLEDAPPRVQPIGYSPEEFERELLKGNRLVREATERGVVLRGGKLIGHSR